LFRSFHYRGSSIQLALRLLDKKSFINLFGITSIQILLGFLDLIGVVVVGAVGALSVQGIESQHPGNRVRYVLRMLNLEALSFQSQVAALAFIAASVLILKTIISVFFTRKTFLFLSEKSSEISANLITKFLSQNLLKIQKLSSQELLFIVSVGVENIMVGILATSVTILSDIAMLIIVLFGLFLIDAPIALGTIILFVLAGWVMHRILAVRAKMIGSNLNRLTVKSNEQILEVLQTYREFIVRDRRQYYSTLIRKSRSELGNLTAERNFQPYISKYVMESLSVIGSICIAAYEFSSKDAAHAVAVLVVFAVASSRIAPAILRVQQAMLTLMNCVGSAGTTFSLLQELDSVNIDDSPDIDPDFIYEAFEPEISIKNLKFAYKPNEKFSISIDQLTIEAGTSVAFVGPSGSGKTTIVDLILGVLEPESGEIKISGIKPEEACKKWSGAISYVPQNIATSGGTFRENVGLGYRRELLTDERIWNAIEISQLESMVLDLPDSLESHIGENGHKISGGQRQRLGIARALFTSPKLLILDEATSSLDGETEANLTEAIEKLTGKVTVVLIAHRLSTVRAVDKIVYVKGGKIISVGTFDEVRKAVPEFEKQASLMGL
jgi:ATP-binding cassette subfamily C protein